MKKVSKLSKLGRVGAILNIIFNAMMFIPLAIFMLPFIGLTIEGDLTYILFIVGDVLLIVATLISILYSSKLLNGSCEYKLRATIFGCVSFAFLGSIFIAASEVEEYIDEKQLNGNIDVLLKYKELYQSGAITEEEYNSVKELLNE